MSEGADISVGRSRRRHLSRDRQERGSVMILEGRGSQAEEMARAKPGVGLYLTCVRNRREGIGMLREEPLGHEGRESWRGASRDLTICGLVGHCRNLGFYSKREMRPWWGERESGRRVS